MANWSELQHDMLEVIAQHLDKIEDYVAFGAVCTPWRAAAAKKNFKGLLLWQQIPCLMLPGQQGEEKNDVVDREFYSLMEGEVVAKVSLPKLKGKKCFESLGWLLIIEPGGDMSLLNPFSGFEIHLPHQNTFPEYERYETDPEIFVEKMVLSARPCETSTSTFTSTSDFVVMLICGDVRFLAFWRPKDQSWNRIETRNSVYADVVYYNGQFYAIDYKGYVVVCDIFGPNPTEARVLFRFSPELWDQKNMYIVESKQSLLLVTRDNVPDFGDDQGVELEYPVPVYGTTEFKVYELEETMTSPSPWKEIKSLGNRALFLGHSASMSMEVSSDSNNNKFAPGIKPNHIYFTDDCWEGYIFIPEGGGKDMGSFNLETRIIEPFNVGRQLLSSICPSIWLTPKF